MACMTSKVDKKALKDADVQEIIRRWRKFSFLRELYTDRNLFKDFESLRQRSLYASNLSPETGTPLTEPSQDHGGIETNHVEQDRLFNPSFKYCFHKCIVLHSTAIACLKFARRAINQTISPVDSFPDLDADARKLESIVERLWQKHATDFGGESGALRLSCKIQCLEVFDFVYGFILPKVLPIERLAELTSWEGNDEQGEYPYDDIYFVQGIDLEYGRTNLFRSRRILQPQDLVELLENGAWNRTKLVEKSMHLQTRGTFGNEEEKQGFWPRIRSQDLRQNPRLSNNAEDPCWWDIIRVRCGSSFLTESLSSYREDLEKLKSRYGREFE